MVHIRDLIRYFEKIQINNLIFPFKFDFGLTFQCLLTTLVMKDSIS